MKDAPIVARIKDLVARRSYGYRRVTAAQPSDGRVARQSQTSLPAYERRRPAAAALHRPRLSCPRWQGDHPLSDMRWCSDSFEIRCWDGARVHESVQTFNVWAYGELARGSGVFVGHEGLTCNHHFLLPKNGTQFHFLPGDYVLEIHAALVHQKPVSLQQIRLHLSDEQAAALEEKHAAVYFDCGPDAGSYHAHVNRKPPEPAIDDPNLLALLHLPPGG
jgi:hypothetical protein